MFGASVLLAKNEWLVASFFVPVFIVGGFAFRPIIKVPKTAKQELFL